MRISKEKYHQLDSIRAVRRRMRRSSQQFVRLYPETKGCRVVVHLKRHDQRILKVCRLKGKFYQE